MGGGKMSSLQTIDALKSLISKMTGQDVNDIDANIIREMMFALH